MMVTTVDVINKCMRALRNPKVLTEAKAGYTAPELPIPPRTRRNHPPAFVPAAGVSVHHIRASLIAGRW
jgi:hypothetical protein